MLGAAGHQLHWCDTRWFPVRAKPHCIRAVQFEYNWEMESWVGRMRMAGWVAAAASLGLGVGLWWVFSRQMPPQIPLWYSQPWGEGQLAEPKYLLLLPGLAVGIGVGINVVTQRLARYGPLALMMTAVGLIVQGMLILAMLRIILIVI